MSIDTAAWSSPVLPALSDTATIGLKDGCETATAYGDTDREYDRLRQGIALVDYCYYGKFSIEGPEARALADQVCMSPIDQLPINRMMRTFILNPDGTVLCDVHITNLGDGYRLFTEGAPPEEVMAALQEEADALEADAEVADLTTDHAILGLDGPYAWELAKNLFGMRIIGVRYLDVVPDQQLGDTTPTVYRGGKTGEFNYWIEIPADATEEIWNLLLEEGDEFDLTPVGTDVLSLAILENRFLDMDREAKQADNVLELNTRVMLDAYSTEFRGSDAVSIDTEIDKRLVGMHVHGPVPSEGNPIYHDGDQIGTVANGAHSPTLDTSIAVGFIDDEYAVAGVKGYSVETDGEAHEVHTVSAPFILNRSLEVRPQENSYFDEN